MPEAPLGHKELVTQLAGMGRDLRAIRKHIVNAAFPNAARKTNRAALSETIDGVLGDMEYLGAVVEEAGKEYGTSRKASPPAAAKSAPATIKPGSSAAPATGPKPVAAPSAAAA